MIAMYDRLGFSAQAGEVLYTDQGMDEIPELALLSDAECESL